MSFVRIRLTFQHSLPHTEVKNCWFLVDTTSCSTVADLEYLIRKRFKGPSKSCHVVNLFLDDFLLPSQEKIEIIQNNDHIRVEIQQTTEEQTGKDGRDEQAAENKVERKRIKSSLPDARDKPKKKQVQENKQVFSNKKIKGNHLQKKRVRDDIEIPKESKKAKREQKSKNAKELVRREAKKEANRRQKSKLSSVVESDGGALLLQEKINSTKVFSPSLTSTISSQMKKLNKPSKGKSAIQQEQMNGIKVSLQGDIRKRKEPSVLLKTGSKKHKTSGKVTLGGGRNVSNSTSSESSSSTDESGTSNSPSKVKKKGKVTLVGGRNGINSDSTSSESSSSSDESGPSNLPSLTNVTPRRVDTDELKKDVRSIITTETSESQGKNKKDTIPQSSLTLCDVTEGTRNGRSFSLSSKASSSLEKSEDFSIFSHKSGKVNSRIESNSKKTLSSLENPALSSRMSFRSPSSGYSHTQTGGTNDRSVEQSASGFNTKQMNMSGQVWPLISINGRPNNKPESSQQTSHIRFDSEESEEERIDKQQEDTGLTNGSAEHLLTNAGSTPYFPPYAQNLPPETSETAVSELEQSTKRDYSLCTRLHGPPRSGDKIAYKVLELSASYTPEISDYKEGTVLAFDPSSGTVKIELTKESLKKSLGDGNVTGKFDMDYDGREENVNDEEEETETVVLWNSMIDPVFV